MSINWKRTALGIELGSTRIKGVLIDECGKVLGTGGYQWENQLIDGVWSYDLDLVWEGISRCYADLKFEINRRYDTILTEVGSIGISGMMHGYLAFDKGDNLLVPFRTWRNNMTEKASKELGKVFSYPIPQRWSIAHFYEAILKEEKHVKNVDYITTLAGYVHWRLTGQKVLGIGDASGMFPIDLKKQDFDQNMLEKFALLCERDKGLDIDLKSLLPRVLVAGENAGSLTEEGARILDMDGDLASGISLCPPEGDAGTGMVATNSVKVRCGNVSAGTSVFAMFVLEENLKNVHHEIDQVTTPAGDLVAMVHSNNCTTELNAWISVFDEVLKSFGKDVDKDELFSILYKKGMEGAADCGGILTYGYHSGEHITGFTEGRPVLMRSANNKLRLGDLIRANLYSALGSLRIGLDILFEEEQVKIETINGHGGFFKTENVGQQIMADAIGVPVSVMDTASEGGAWGVALLANYMLLGREESLDSYLDQRIFVNSPIKIVEPNLDGVRGFEAFMKRYIEGMQIEEKAIEILK